jgi:hypothetical protein
MVAFPINEQATTCQNCHPQDYSARAEKFASVAGVSAFHPEVPTAIGAVQVIEPPDGILPAPFLSAQVLEPWRLVGLGLLAIVLVILIVLGYRCWKADCLAKMR